MNETDPMRPSRAREQTPTFPEAAPSGAGRPDPVSGLKGLDDPAPAETPQTGKEFRREAPEGRQPDHVSIDRQNGAVDRRLGDLADLLQATGLPGLFLDAHLRMRLFTPAASRLFGLHARDIGRSLPELAPHQLPDGLVEAARRVLRAQEPFERELCIDETGEVFVARLTPWRGGTDTQGCVVVFVNVTERNPVEIELESSMRALREQYAELEAIYDQTPVGLCLLDRELRWVRINRRLAEINGFPVEAHIGKRAADLLPDIEGRVTTLLQQVLHDGEVRIGVEFTGETPARPGVPRTWVSDYYPIRLDGKVIAVGTAVREVTEERRLARDFAAQIARVSESEARLSRLFDAAPAVIALLEGPDHVYSYVNPRHEALFRRGDVVGRPAREVFPELAGRGIFQRLDRVFRTGEPEAEFELRLKVMAEDGSSARIGVFQQILQPWLGPDGKVGGVMSFLHDVTDEVEAREAARAARARLQSVQDSLLSFVGLLDAEGVLLEANRTALDAAALIRDDVIGKPFWDCYWWSYDPEIQAGLRAAIDRVRQGEIVRYDVRIRVAEDHYTTIDFQLVPSFGPDGSVTEMVPSGIDISERTAFEARQRLLIGELQHRVKNTLATVQSIMRFTARTATGKDELRAALQDRLAALARTHDALTRRDWSGQTVRAILEQEATPYLTDGLTRVDYAGPDVDLTPAASISVGLAFHELMTNAAKHGALAAPEGRIRVTVEADPDGAFRSLHWSETGGPPVAPPGSEGFGTFLLKRVLATELAASIDLDYAAAGFACRIEVCP